MTGSLANYMFPIVFSSCITGCSYGFECHSGCGAKENDLGHQPDECSEEFSEGVDKTFLNKRSKKSSNKLGQCDFSRHHFPTW